MGQPRVANAPCSWGILEFGLEGESAPYTRVLDEMCETGYEGTELGDWGFMPTDPDMLRAELEKRDLTMLGAFVPVALVDPQRHESGLEVAVRTARLLAELNPRAFVVLADDNGTNPIRTKWAGRIASEQGLSDEEWTVFADGAERIARQVRDETGLRTVFHHHCAGYVETPSEVETLLKRTNPDSIGLCFDTGHYAYGGGDPVSGLRKHTDRIWHVHFKDCHPEIAAQARREEWDYFTAVRNGVFCEMGKGGVNFSEVTSMLNDRGYDGWIVVEQDVLPGMGTPKESAKRNRQYLQDLGL